MTINITHIKKSPFCFLIYSTEPTGIIESMWGVGAIIGFQISATTIGLWVDFYRVDTETIDITPRDPRYVGAWWIGFLIVSALFLFFATPFWGFPRRLQNRECANRQQKQNGNLSKIGESGHRGRSKQGASSFKGMYE